MQLRPFLKSKYTYFTILNYTKIFVKRAAQVRHNCRTPDWQSSPVQLLIGKSGRLYIRVVVCSVVRHGRDSSDVTLALEDAQVVRRSVGRY